MSAIIHLCSISGGQDCNADVGGLVSSSAVSLKAVCPRKALVTSPHASLKWTDLCSTCSGTAETWDSDLFWQQLSLMGSQKTFRISWYLVCGFFRRLTFRRRELMKQFDRND